MHVTFGCWGSWFEDQIVAENMTSSNAQSKQSRITCDGCSLSSQSARTASRASATIGCSQICSAAISCWCCSSVATGCPCIGAALQSYRKRSLYTENRSRICSALSPKSSGE